MVSMEYQSKRRLQAKPAPNGQPVLQLPKHDQALTPSVHSRQWRLLVALQRSAVGGSRNRKRFLATASRSLAGQQVLRWRQQHIGNRAAVRQDRRPCANAAPRLRIRWQPFRLYHPSPSNRMNWRFCLLLSWLQLRIQCQVPPRQWRKERDEVKEPSLGLCKIYECWYRPSAIAKSLRVKSARLLEGL